MDGTDDDDDDMLWNGREEHGNVRRVRKMALIVKLETGKGG